MTLFDALRQGCFVSVLDPAPGGLKKVAVDPETLLVLCLPSACDEAPSAELLAHLARRCWEKALSA